MEIIHKQKVCRCSVDWIVSFNATGLFQYPILMFLNFLKTHLRSNNFFIHIRSWFPSYKKHSNDFQSKSTSYFLYDGNSYKWYILSHATSLFLYPLKTLEKQRFSDVFRGVQKETSGMKWVKKEFCGLNHQLTLHRYWFSNQAFVIAFTYISKTEQKSIKHYLLRRFKSIFQGSNLNSKLTALQKMHQ